MCVEKESIERRIKLTLIEARKIWRRNYFENQSYKMAFHQIYTLECSKVQMLLKQRAIG